MANVSMTVQVLSMRINQIIPVRLVLNYVLNVLMLPPARLVSPISTYKLIINVLMFVHHLLMVLMISLARIVVLCVLNVMMPVLVQVVLLMPYCM